MGSDMVFLMQSLIFVQETIHPSEMAATLARYLSVGVSADDDVFADASLTGVLQPPPGDSIVRANFEPLWLTMGTIQVLLLPKCHWSIHSPSHVDRVVIVQSHLNPTCTLMLNDDTVTAQAAYAHCAPPACGSRDSAAEGATKDHQHRHLLEGLPQTCKVTPGPGSVRVWNSCGLPMWWAMDT